MEKLYIQLIGLHLMLGFVLWLVVTDRKHRKHIARIREMNERNAKRIHDRRMAQIWPEIAEKHPEWFDLSELEQ